MPNRRNQQRRERRSSGNRRSTTPFLPARLELPFLAYGLFKPGEPAYFRIQPFVSRATKIEVTGRLRIQDGMPVLCPGDDYVTTCYLLEFDPQATLEAYEAIEDLEPANTYHWAEERLRDGRKANILRASDATRESRPIEDGAWSGWEDPLFKEALDVVQNLLKQAEDRSDLLKSLFQIEAGYLLLWSAIERYTALRYGLTGPIAVKRKKLANEPGFRQALLRHVEQVRDVRSADRTYLKQTLDRSNPVGSIHYYYQVRSNLVHRGKTAIEDHGRVRSALQQLLPIFRDVLESARSEAERVPPP